MEPTLDELVHFVTRHGRLFVLTGAGVSTDSGIPDYRDAEGAWKRRPPVQYLDFVRSPQMRRRYWTRSLVGWPRMASARPNAAHAALAALEANGRVGHLVTQNVDGLHQKAGSREVLDLHGRLDAVVCLGCRRTTSRDAFQAVLFAANPSWRTADAPTAPDGDADLPAADTDAFVVPDCPRCGGIWKPDVIFFGENVPKARVAAAYAHLASADAVLVVGSSLMVFSGYRFVRQAAKAGQPVAIVSAGRTRGDDVAAVKIAAPCGPLLGALVGRLGGEAARYPSTATSSRSNSRSRPASG